LIDSSLIQTLTVGFGISPNQSFLQESRTITAGRELRPAPKKLFEPKVIIILEMKAIIREKFKGSEW